jgi:hypothetical protein
MFHRLPETVATTVTVIQELETVTQREHDFGATSRVQHTNDARTHNGMTPGFAVH